MGVYYKGDGCKSCPVENCQTMQYRGSTCAAQRAKCGVEADPFSWGDKIRSSDNEYIARQLYNFFVGGMKTMAECAGIDIPDIFDKESEDRYCTVVMKQLNAPYQELQDVALGYINSHKQKEKTTHTE